MAVSEYDIGDLIYLSATFTNEAGALADPTTVTAQIRRVVGGLAAAPSDLTPVRLSLGVWTVDYSCTAEGAYYYRFAGTGAVQQAAEGVFKVRPSRFA